MSVSDGSNLPARKQDNQVAIIGMAGRFPGARDAAEFWTNVRDGVEAIRSLSDQELLAAGVTRAELSDPDYVKACPVLDDIDKLDARFFGFSPRDASVMDPAQRFFLEVAWEAVEHSGYTCLPEDGPVGVFAGSGAPSYMMENLRTNPELMRSMGEFLVRHTGNDMNFLATRVSYEMDLRGPSINVQTACSSALVAVHMACRSLLGGECKIALAGGSTILVPNNGRGYVYKDGEILSPDGHCRPFDAKSAGTVFGSGTGCVVLKRLEDALDDGDTIHAVIRGSAINNDGAVKVGYLAPGVDGQAAVIEGALRDAGVPAESISYIETHGTGTRVGDPIEVEALNQAFRSHTDKRRFCAIGSVKSNIGHLGEAAAAASLIKAVMALKHRQLPPSLGYERPNPAIDFDESPFYVNAELRTWQSEGPRRCGITALGAGGTNCHVILEEAPARIDGEGARPRQLLVLSAKTKAALDRSSDNLGSALEQDLDLDLADVAYTLAVGRRVMNHRRVIAVRDRAEAIALLRDRDSKRVVSGLVEADEPSVVFMFPGGGAQYARMGFELYEGEDAYRDAVDACLALMEPALRSELRALIFAAEADAEKATRKLERPSLTLPSLFTTEYALAKLLMSWGVTPVAFLGHSMGEYVAACLAGVVRLEDALQLVMLRGRLFEAVDAGAMLSVPMSEAALRAFMPPGLDIAAVNAPELSVASGPVAAIEALQASLLAREIESTRIRIDVAAHSAMLDPILGQFRKLCRTITFQAPTIPFVSNLTGRWITPAQATDPEYWVKHLRSTVRFADCVQTVMASGERVLFEVGPGRTLSMLARAQEKPVRHAFNSMRHPQELAGDLEYALTTLGRLWSCGVEIDWTAFYEGQLRNRVPLPTYPFERQSFWVEPGRAVERVGSRELVKRSDVGEWFYGLGWVRAPLLSGQATREKTRWLVLANDRSEGRELSRALRRVKTDEVVLVTPGEHVHQESPANWLLDFHSADQFAELIQALDERGERFHHVLYLVGHTRKLPDLARLKDIEIAQSLTQSFYSLTYLVRALGGLTESVHLSVVTSELADVGEGRLDPLRATVLGPVFVAPRELPHVRTRCIDVPSRFSLTRRSPKLLERLLEELRGESEEQLVALRPNGRWVQRISPLPVPKQDSESTSARPWIRESGVYLITGGLGGIGLEVATHMARQRRVKLVLLARGGLPPESTWDAVLAQAGVESQRAQRIRRVQALRELGADVHVVAADVTDPVALRSALDHVRAQLGPITGVVHAAGVMDDEPMQSKTLATMSRVLAPKVLGTLALDALTADDNLDFFVLFSSVASFLGLPGQVDYTAANAFLDVFAHERSRRAPGHTAVINWNAWRDVGMAEAARRGDSSGREPAVQCSHPVFDGYSDDTAGRLFSADLSIARQWLLAEHRIKGSFALLPGTAFVELARAAFATDRAQSALELSNLTFLRPFQVAEGETRRLHVQLSPTDEGVDIAMHQGTDTRAPLVVGSARAYNGAVLPALDLRALQARCNVREETPENGYLAQDFVDFGPRWGNIVRIHYGHGEALIELSLPDAFHDDLASFGLHPAVLDMATGGAQPLIPGVDLSCDFYVPMGYGRVIVVAPMPAHSFSYVRCLPDTGNGLAHFDVTLTDATGSVFAEIARFTMKRLDRSSAMTASTSHVGRSDQRRNEVMDALLREAIAPAEGLEAFDRVMAQPSLVQAVVSSVDVLTWQAQLATTSVTNQALGGADSPAGFTRPNLSTEYEAPATATEVALARIWCELLGMSMVGTRDDFFDLGGNSLVAVRLFAAIKKQFRAALPLATLFEASTIKQLAMLLDASGAGARDAATNTATTAAPEGPTPAARVDTPPPTVARATSYSPLVPIQVAAGLPFFCVHGAGGNVLNFRGLAKSLGPEQSFYGLQAKGVTGGEPAASIEEMASTYIDAIRATWPDGPYVLGGYSGGGVVAFEMAQRLRAAGVQVELVLLDTFHPAGRARPPSRQERFSRLVAEGAPYLSRIGKAKWTRVVEGMSNELKIRYFLSRNAPMPFELREMHLTNAFDEAALKYQPKRYEGTVTLYRARAINPVFAHVGPMLGWGAVAPRLRIVEVPGNHKTVMDEPNVQAIIRDLKELIAAASR